MIDTFFAHIMLGRSMHINFSDYENGLNLAFTA